MGSLTALMDLSRGALRADQAALDVTAENVANQNTVGYTRQVVNWTETDSLTLSANTPGRGLSLTASSQRDRILEQRVQQQTQTASQGSARTSVLNQLQAVFALSSTSAAAGQTAIGTALDGFYASLSTLSAAPSDAGSRQGVLSSAETLARTFRSAANQIGQIASGVDHQVSAAVAQVNTLTASIASLNLRIGSLDPGQDAGALEDHRQQAIGDLSKLIGLHQILTEANGISLTTQDGSVLVGGGQAFALSTLPVAGSAHVFAGSGGQDLSASITGGLLGGLLQASQTDIPATSVKLDQLAFYLADSVNQQNALGLDAAGLPAGKLFTLPATPAGTAATLDTATTNLSAVAAAAPGQGSGGSGNAYALGSLANTALAATGQTPSATFASLLADLGSTVSGALSDDTVQQATLLQLTTQRNGLSGVSLDQEAANLTRYQRSYEAAARIFSILNTLLAASINLGQQTTV